MVYKPTRQNNNVEYIWIIMSMRLFKENAIRLAFVLAILALSLTACFRDAGNGNANPTVVNIEDLPTSTPAPTATRLLPTFTPTVEIAATKTEIVGGPPVDATASDDVDGNEAAEDTDAQTPATLSVATFTPVPPEEATLAPPGVSDTGLSPTPSLTISPTNEPLQATPTSFEQADPCVYRVQGGDTLFSIAQDFDLFPEDFYPVNPALAANPNSLSIGQEIRIPNCDAEPTDAAATPAEDQPPDTTPTNVPTDDAGQQVPQGAQTYTIQEGDTLFSIATRFGVTVQDIVAATDFLVNENTIIRPGDVIVIPAAE
jgi:LysM repeat protein